MKILITGGKGQLGTEIYRGLSEGKTEIGEIPAGLKGAEVLHLDIDRLDISKSGEVRETVKQFLPDVIINCAAYTNVDKCETEADSAFAANALGPRNLAMAANESGAKLIQISTDYVFDGKSAKPYREWDICNPQSIYGFTKYQGEQFVKEFCSRYFIIRTAWLYGSGNNFVKTILRAAKEKGAVKVVDDQRGNPTSAVDLAHHILKLAITEEYGTYHCTCGGECSWYEFARAFIHLSGIPCEITPCSTEEFPRPARRPAYSSLDNMMLRCTVGDETRHWKDAVTVYMAQYNKESGEFNK